MTLLRKLLRGPERVPLNGFSKWIPRQDISLVYVGANDVTAPVQL